MKRTTPKPPPSTDYCHTCQKWVEPVTWESPVYSAGQGSWSEMESTERCPICGNEVDKYEATP